MRSFSFCWADKVNFVQTRRSKEIRQIPYQSSFKFLVYFSEFSWQFLNKNLKRKTFVLLNTRKRGKIQWGLGKEGNLFAVDFVPVMRTVAPNKSKLWESNFASDRLDLICLLLMTKEKLLVMVISRSARAEFGCSLAN